MAALSHPSSAQGLAGFTPSAQRAAIFSHVGAATLSNGMGRDWRAPAGIDTFGTILNNNRVMVKPDASSPELPYAGARVRLHHLVSGRLDWQGLSDAQGYYHATGLVVGDWYYPVAIDLTGTHECDAAGPVQAVRAS